MMKLFYGLLFLFIVLNDALKLIPRVGYWDELSVFVAPLCVFIVQKGKLKVSKDKARLFLLLIIIVLIGLIGNMLHPGIQKSNIAILKDILAFIKFPFLMILLSGISKYINQKSAIDAAATVSRLFIIVSFVGLFIGKVFNIGLYTNETRIFQTYQFVFPHPTYLVSALVISIAVLLAQSRGKNLKYILLGIIPLFMAQRFKGYAVITVIIFAIILKENWIRKIIKTDFYTRIDCGRLIPLILAVSIVIFMIFKNRMETYLLWGMTSARIALYIIGFKILIDFFPFGSGFGTFASYISGEYYSKIYNIYNISSVDGLRPDKFNYMADTLWPWIYGQLGLIGAILYMVLMLSLFMMQLKCLKNTDHIIAFALIWFYILLASCMEAYLTNTSAIAVAIFLTLYLGVDQTKGGHCNGTTF